MTITANKKLVAHVASIPDAIARYCKTTRRDAVESMKDWIDMLGHDLLASHSESTTGRPLWILPEGSGFAVYEA